MMDRKRIESLITKWERWCVDGAWLEKPLHERARIALITELSELMGKVEK